ncbi:hypothetical protein F5884DRAFT_823062 [Xylogone sp. PMI_703]|nr:hypothetical protein F5884DRAFT_823062 [Xylogone sp. PMI_703]
MWASRTRKEFKWREWRYQVFYEAPIFFTAPSGITVGPLTRRKPKVKLRDLFWRDYDNEKSLVNSRAIQQRAIAMEVIEIQKHVLTIYKITGTENSCKHTMTPMNNEGKIGLDYMQDEGCSWLLLLEALQEQERESRIWDNTPSHGLDHPICYFIQRFRRCWDHMPPNIREPYATTNICHLVEIMSMLGLVWKEFDVNKPSLNAEGNGYMVKGEYISGLGGSSILMRFTRLSKPGHGENRIIPCYELKRLCFGEVPSLFDTVKENLQVSPGRLEHCLKRLLPKLSYEHRQLFLLNTTNKPLMFPITFELIAMLAKSAHIPGSKFRRLPNPCADTWNPVLDVAACLRAFAGSINDNSNFGSHRLVTELQNLFRYGRIDTLVLTYGQSLEQKIKAYSDAASHLADENADRYYYPEYERQTVKDQAAQIYNTRLLDLLDSLHWALERVDERLRDMVDTPEFSEVVTLHLAAVLDQQPILNAELAHATRDNPKEKILISFYFNNIYPAVVKGSAEEQRAVADPGPFQKS